MVDPTPPNTTLPCVEATVTLAVIVEPFKPNDTLLLLLKTKLLPELLVVPPLRIILP